MKKTMMRAAAALMAMLVAAGCMCTKPGRCCGGEPLRHVVLFKFKDGTAPEQVKAVEDAFRALPSKVPEIADFEWGTDVSPEKLAQGYTHCFFLTFKDAAARDAYLPHPAHKAFGALLGPHLDKVLVVDYVAKD